MRTGSIIGCLAMLLFAAGCSHDIEKPVQIEEIEGTPEIPRNIETRVGDGEVELSWTVSNPALVKLFFIYRGDTANVAPEIVDSTAAMTYLDSSVRNSVRYIYQVAALSNDGLLGKLSASVSATPSLYSITIANGSKYTSQTSVTVSTADLGGSRYMMLSNDSLFTGANWLSFAAEQSWELESGDGVKWVYAKFRDYEGNETRYFVKDEIILDTRAAIDSVTESSGGAVLDAGDLLHFALYAGEPEGMAAVEVPVVGTLTLYDDGSSGDALAADGVYELDWVIPGAVDLIDGLVGGYFTDAAGNQADSKSSSTFLNIANPPAASILSAYVLSESEIELVWTRCNESDFAGYLLFRGDSPAVDTTGILLKNENVAGNTDFRDTDLEPATSYYYVIYTLDHSGLSSKSNVTVTTTEVNQAPAAVSLFIVNQDTTSLTIGWTKND
ncbi:MAG: fibronectin type III domain-containing protein, partial [candidate division Zixibacteria bacterium]|nr:fibronectin type III domain-containing protein [candidate division Zixibacteria bacterium]